MITWDLELQRIEGTAAAAHLLMLMIGRLDGLRARCINV